MTTFEQDWKALLSQKRIREADTLRREHNRDTIRREMGLHVVHLFDDFYAVGIPGYFYEVRKIQDGKATAVRTTIPSPEEEG